MAFRAVTLNLEQDHKRWPERRRLVLDEIVRLMPDLIAFNEVCVPLQTARDLAAAAAERTGIAYNLVQQTRVNGLSKVEGEALLTRFPVIETGNFDFQTRDIVALVARAVGLLSERSWIPSVPTPKLRRRSRRKRRGAAAEGPTVVQGPWNPAPTPPVSPDQAALDALLVKIHASGMDSLTDHEREQLLILRDRLRRR